MCSPVQEMAQYLPILRHQGKAAGDGGGPRDPLTSGFLQLTTVGYLGIVQNCSECEIKVPDLGMAWTLLARITVSNFLHFGVMTQIQMIPVTARTQSSKQSAHLVLSRISDKLPPEAGVPKSLSNLSISELGGNEFRKCLFQLLG
jgi:hypothetical protein